MSNGLTGKVMKLLEILFLAGGTMDLKELSERSDIPKSTVHRILTSLGKDRWVIQDPRTRLYRLGPRMMIFAKERQIRQELVRQSDIPMRDLVKEAGETTVLAVPDGEVARCVHIVETPKAIKFSFSVGGELPIYAGAMGKILLAYCQETFREWMLDQSLRPFTENTLIDSIKLREELTAIRERGYSISIEEINPGGMAIGAPVLSSRGDLIAGLILSGPRFKFEDKSGDLVIPVMETAKRIERNLA
ncbi:MULTISPECIES: IclR family transcriptional regulator [Dethiosulfovibrio]|uniref:IclR family transcriptional regulator n=2 Tax=Dethiosulfovibrio TaxID=47054 RepID=A0ABS9ER51_9BACT|nr:MULTISPECIES: IclR family transcriptional regulator [Dethiosulfovibrio]MCF4114188.1 IclR family transcriptional regulator [Dethiosulfovibrio russensis]MCF4142622.1 IclR family transcriptional regulator [Dethiosulfovibrio marinus]MCF4145141.1 IclR family transcriptional regulator [Dethiosulfovibrio acidaminovorans]